MTKIFKSALIIVLLLCSLSSEAQKNRRKGGKRKEHSADFFSQNRFMAGFSTSGSIFNKKSIGTANLKLGYFVIDGLSLGLGGQYKISGKNNTEKLGGAYARYYFRQNRFSPFAEANYFAGNGQIKDDPTPGKIFLYKVSQIGGAAGISYAGILNVLGVEVFGEFFQETVSSTKKTSAFNYFLSVRIYASI